MKQGSALNWLVPMIVILAVITAGVGLFSQDGNGPFTFTTVHGNVVEMYGKGIYRNDSLFVGAAFKGTDAVTLFLGIPVLLSAYLHHRRGSLRWTLVMMGALSYFLYNGASMTFAAMFNSMFLFYTALFSASVFATIIAFTTFDPQKMASGVSPNAPRRGMATFMFVAGLGTLAIWMSDLIGPLLRGQVPEIMGPYTTLFTHEFDSAIITPAAVIAGVYLLQRKLSGYLLAVPILILCTLIGVVVIGQTISQYLAGIVFPVSVYIGMVGSWVAMGAFAIGLTIKFFRNFEETGQGRYGENER